MNIHNVVLPEKYRLLCKEKVTEYMKDMKFSHNGAHNASKLRSILQKYELMIHNKEIISPIGCKSFRQFVEGTDLFQYLEKQSKHYKTPFASFMKNTLRHSMAHLITGRKRRYFFHNAKSNIIFCYFAFVAASLARFHHLRLWRGGYCCNLCKESLPFYLKSYGRKNKMIQIDKNLNYQTDKENFIHVEVEKLLFSTHRTIIDAKLKFWFKTVKGIISLKRLTIYLWNDKTNVIKWLRQYSSGNEMDSQEKHQKSLSRFKNYLFDDAKDEKILLYIISQWERTSKIRKKNLNCKRSKMFASKAYTILQALISTSNKRIVDDMAKRIFKLTSRLMCMQQTISLLSNRCPCKVADEENNTDDVVTTQCNNVISKMYRYFELLLSDLGIVIFSK